MKEDEFKNVEKIIEDVRKILINTAIEKYEDASIAGLCAEGAWEAAIDGVRTLNLKKILLEENQNNKKEDNGKKQN